MLLSKEIAVELNLIGYKLKHYIAVMLKKHNVPLSPEQFLLADLLWNHGSMSQQELADLLQKDKNSVTKLVDGLERKGFVKRTQNKDDRRSNTIVLTDAAEVLKPEAKRKGIFILDEMLDDIDEQELRSFLSTLRKLNCNMTVNDNDL